MVDFNGTLKITEENSIIKIGDLAPHETGTLTVTSFDEVTLLVIHEEVFATSVDPQPANTEYLVVETEHINVVTVTEQGLPGVKGDPGEAGEAGRTDLNIIFEEESFTIANPPNYSYNLLHTPIEKSVLFYLNGIKEKPQNFAIVNNTIVIEDLDVRVGDEITVHYMYGV